MTDMEIIHLKKEAIQLWKSQKLDKATDLILRLEKIKSLKNDFKFNLIFSNCLNDNKKYSLAVRFLTRATKIRPESELASNFLFVNLIKCKAYNLAMSELERFLSKYPAKKYYRITLHELLEDLNKGNAQEWKDTIINYSKINNILINRYYPTHKER
jgi:hypothetical protein